MRIIDTLNDLEKRGLLTPLFQAGVLSQTAKTYQQIFLVFSAYRDADKCRNVTEAVNRTAEDCRVSEDTVWRAKKIMEQMVA
jgi:hypothetical protein